MIENDTVYFIDVRKHPKGPEFTSFDFLEILEESNWLEVIGFTQLNDIIEMHPIVEKNEDIYLLTKLGLNLSYKINQKYYLQVMGITSIGSKSNHTFTLIALRKKLDAFLKEFDHIEYIDFDLLLNDSFGRINYKISSEEKYLIL